MFFGGYNWYTFQFHIIEYEGRETDEVGMEKSELGRWIKI